MGKTNVFNSALLPVLLTVGCFLLAWYTVLPNYYETKAKLETLEKEVLAARAKYNSLETTKEDLAEMDDVMDLIYISVSEDADEPNLITELEAISTKHELAIPSISVSDSGESEEDSYYDNSGSVYGAIDVGFSVVGDFEKLNQFIASLEKSVKFMNIQSLSYQSSEEDDLIYLSIRLETYKY